jgi:16S rRNA (uracil1498-N3)-methyltransferase
VSLARFFGPAATATGDLVTLPQEEAEHLTRVLRLGAGDRVRVFNGRGGEFEAVVDGERGAVRVRLEARRQPAAEARVSVTLAQAVLKGDKMDEVVRDAVMLGVSAIQPIITARAESSLASIARANRRERWERVSIASAKQCGRAVVPAILEPKPFTVHDRFNSEMVLPSPIFMLVEPGHGSGARLGDMDVPATLAATLVVGPEGGWTSEELHAASALATSITLGARTLRADAMAIVALSALFTRCGEF